MPLDAHHYYSKSTALSNGLSVRTDVVNASESVKFNPEPMILALLDNLASGCPRDQESTARVKKSFPWLWNPSWGDDIGIGVGEVGKLKRAIQQADFMVKSLDAFLECSRDRLRRLRTSLYATTTKTFFPLLPDDVLALIFEFASSPLQKSDIWNFSAECDNNTAARISQVSRRFRDIALKLPYLWRVLHSRSHTLSDVDQLASRSVSAGPILEVHMESEVVEPGRRNDTFIRFFTHVTTLSLASRIRSLTLKFVSGFEEDLTKLKKEHDSLCLPALRELVLDYSNPTNEEAFTYFYESWDLPSLRSLRARNVVPIFVFPSVLCGIFECSLSLESFPFGGVPWAYDAVKHFLSSLSEVQVLDLLLRREVMNSGFRTWEPISLPSVVHLITSFPNVRPYMARAFCQTVQTVNKQRWTLEIEADKNLEYPMLNLVESLFPDYLQRVVLRDLDDVYKLKELNIMFRHKGSKENWEDVRKLAQIAKSLKRLSVSYPAVQLRKFSLKERGGKRMEMLVKQLKEKVDLDFSGRETIIYVDEEAEDIFDS